MAKRKNGVGKPRKTHSPKAVRDKESNAREKEKQKQEINLLKSRFLAVF